MAAPLSIPGVPSLDATPVLNRDFDPRGTPMTPEDYFVLTRVDGRASFRQILLMVGFPEPHTLEILTRLRQMGAILLPGEAPPERRRMALGTDAPTAAADAPPDAPPVASSGPAAAPTAPRPERPRRPSQTPAADAAGDSPERTPTPVPRRGRPVTIDPAALAEVCDLTEEQKLAILSKHGSLVGATLFEVLDLGPDAEKKAIKRSYFRISKEFHPDRFYGKKLGSFEARLAQIFKAANDAYAILDDDDKRAAYVARLQHGALQALGVNTGALAPATQSKSERAAELFDAGCQHEVTGDRPRALKEFAAAIALDPLPRYLRRAAEACIHAQELRSAEEYAKKFAALSPRDAQAHRTLAKVYRAQGRTQEALTELELATKLDPESIHIAGELDEVRRLVSS